MEEQPHLIYDSFLVNDRAESYRLPSGSGSHSFSSVNHNQSQFNFDDTCPRTDLENSWEHIPFSFEDSLDEWFNSNANSFRSQSGPALDNSLCEIQPVQNNLSVNNVTRPLKVSENLLQDSPFSSNNATMRTTKKKLESGHDGESQPKLIQYIEQVIENGMKSPSVRAGRPKQEFDTSYETLRTFYEEYTRGLQNLIETNYSKKRSDTFRNTIFSYLKKLPIKLREMSCSVSEPKSKKLEVFLDAFLTPFVTCFLPHFNIDKIKVSKVKLFLYFICICYPEDKCSKIISTLSHQNALPKESLQEIKSTLVLRKGKSKKDISTFIT